MIRRRHIPLAALAIMSMASTVHAQFWAKLTAPRTTVTISHPPLMALPGVQKVAVTEIEGDRDCAQPLTDRLNEVLSTYHKFEVLDRVSLQSVLREQNLATTGLTDPSAAAALGKILGPTAIITGRVTTCTLDQSPLVNVGTDNKGNITYKITVKMTIAGSFNIIDVSSARNLGTRTVHAVGSRDATAVNGSPVPPDAEDVKAIARQDYISQVSRYLVPWHETQSVVVHNDDDWGLKKGATLLKAGAAGDAVTAFEESVKAHEKDPTPNEKILPKALYDLGIALVCDGRPQEGLDYLKKSLAVKDGDITTEAIALANRMIGAQRQTEMQALRASAVTAQPPAPAAAAPPPAPVKAAAPTTTPPAANGGTADIEVALAQLKSLFDKGLITKIDYDKKKAELLKKFGSSE